MKRTLFIPMAALLLLAACSDNSPSLMANNQPELAAAGSAHFIKSATSCTRVGNDLRCDFKEAGLSSGATENIQLSVAATAGYSCVNGGQNIPSDPKKTESSTVTTQGTFAATKNGNLVGFLVASPPPSTLSCPNGQTLTLITVSYGPTATIQDLTSGASISVSGF